MTNTIAEYETEQVQRANASGLQPVVFVHGLWLLPNSWEPWVKHFEAAGYTALTPGWPDDPETVAAANADPEVFARKTIGKIAGHYEQIIRGLDKKPAIIGHSFGGLMTLILAGRALSAASVAISPAPFQGVLPLPLAALKSAWPVLSNPANRNRAVALTFEQFQFAFGNALDPDEARALYERYAVPGAGAPLFESATANINPWSEDKVADDPDRGPMLLIAGENDHTVPPPIVRAAYGIEQRNAGVTEYQEVPGRGHSLTIDRGWQTVADAALTFVERFVPAKATA